MMMESTTTVSYGDANKLSSTIISPPPAPQVPSHQDACNSFFEHAAHHNADGVVSLQKGDCGRAFHSFVATLTALQKFRDYQMAHMAATATPPVQQPPATTKSKNCKAIAVPYLEDSGFFIYNNAVIFSRKPRIVSSSSAAAAAASDDGGSSCWQLDTIAFCEAVTQFNLALAYHQRGKYCGEDKTLIGALELYEQSLSTLGRIQCSTLDSNDETKVLRLAVMNNRIHILNEIARYPTAQLLVNDLLLQSVNALSASGDANALSFLTRSDIDNFLLNALVIRRFNTAPCA